MRMAHSSPIQARQAFAKRSRLATAVLSPSRVSSFSSQEKLGKFSGKDAPALLKLAWVRLKITPRQVIRNLGFIELSGFWLDELLRRLARGSIIFDLLRRRYILSTTVSHLVAGDNQRFHSTVFRMRHNDARKQVL